MDHIFLYCVAGGVIIVLILFAARVAIRWIVRLALIGLLLCALGGAAWWWTTRTKDESDSKPRPASTSRRSGSERR